MEHPTTIAVDLAKSVFEVAVSNEPGRVCQQRRLTRNQMAGFFANRPPATVLMEACGTAHYWGWLLQGFGHRVLLLPAQHTCAATVCATRPMRPTRWLCWRLIETRRFVPVPVKELPQQAIAALHRIRSGWIATRTARLNTVRGLLRELGINIPLGASRVLSRLSDALSDPQGLIPESLHLVLLEAATEIHTLEQDAETGRTAAGDAGQVSAGSLRPAFRAWHRPSDLDRADRLGGRSLPIQFRAAPVQLSGHCPARAFLRLFPTPGRDHQTRRFLPANPPDTRRPFRPLGRQTRQEP